MKILRRYQLDIIFLFFAFIILIALFFWTLEFYGLNPHKYEFFIVIPLIIIYFGYLWEIRSKISLNERRKLTNKTLIYWIILGITIFLTYTNPAPISAKDYISIELFFIVFTLLLADSYWDFKKLSIKNLFLKK